jgi:hypothetical protein
MIRLVEPAVYTVAVLHPQPAELWNRLRAELDAQGSPPIRLDHEDGSVTFTADTWELMLRSRVADALMTVCGHDEWTRAFRPLD